MCTFLCMGMVVYAMLLHAKDVGVLKHVLSSSRCRGKSYDKLNVGRYLIGRKTNISLKEVLDMRLKRLWKRGTVPRNVNPLDLTKSEIFVLARRGELGIFLSSSRHSCDQVIKIEESEKIGERHLTDHYIKF